MQYLICEPSGFVWFLPFATALENLKTSKRYNVFRSKGSTASVLFSLLFFYEGMLTLYLVHVIPQIYVMRG